MITPYLTDPITIKAFVSRDKYQQVNYVYHEVYGRFEFKTKFLTSGVTYVADKRQQVVSTSMAYFSEDLDLTLGRPFSHEDRIIFESIEYVPLLILKPESFYDPHYEIFFG